MASLRYALGRADSGSKTVVGAVNRRSAAMHELYHGIGSNLGDRQANLLAALQRLRSRAAIFAVSGFYESQAAGGATGPAYLNVAVGLRYAGRSRRLRTFCAGCRVGRRTRARSRRLEPRPIDIDLLVVDGDIVHPRARRASVRCRTAARNRSSVRRDAKAMRGVTAAASAPCASKPIVKWNAGGASLPSRAGVSRRATRRAPRRSMDANVYNADFSMVADVAPDQAGVHMSRFAEALEEATLVVLSKPRRPHDRAPRGNDRARDRATQRATAQRSACEPILRWSAGRP